MQDTSLLQWHLAAISDSAAELEQTLNREKGEKKKGKTENPPVQPTATLPPVIAFLQGPYEKYLRLSLTRDLSRALCQERDLITSPKL